MKFGEWVCVSRLGRMRGCVGVLDVMVVVVGVVLGMGGEVMWLSLCVFGYVMFDDFDICGCDWGFVDDCVIVDDEDVVG